MALTLCTALESRGIKCWISSRDIMPGENFQSAIVRAIRNSKIMLLVFTANSNNSEEMNKELALASQNKLMVVPLRIEDVAPNDAFAYEFATRQWIDFFADWENAIQQLIDRIGHATGITAVKVQDAPTPAATPEPEPPPPAEAAAVPEEAPAPIEAAAEPRSFQAEAAETLTEDAPQTTAETDDEAPKAPRRLGLYAALSVILLLIVGAGLVAPGLRRAKAQHPEVRAMVVMPAPAPAGPQAAPPSVPGAVDATTPADQPVVKPTKHKKAAQAKAEDEVPY